MSMSDAHEGPPDASDTSDPPDVFMVAGPQAVSAVTPHEPPAIAPPVLSDAERSLLIAVLDCIIPIEGDLPGAGVFGIAAPIERTLAASLTLRRLFLDGLMRITLAGARHAPDATFVSLDAERQDAALSVVEREHPAFFAALVDHTYRNYYADPRIHALIGWDSRPPQPLGHQLLPFDPALLERQRTRAPFWRTIA